MKGCKHSQHQTYGGMTRQSSALVYRYRDALAHCLRQRRLCLGQPEGHVHGAIQLDGGGQLGAGLVAPFQPGIQLPEAEVAVGHERAHAELLGQGEGLAVVGFGLIALRRLAPRRNVAEEAQGIRLVTSFLVRTGERQRTLGEGVRLLQAAGQQLRLPQGETTERLIDLPFPLQWSVPSPA